MSVFNELLPKINEISNAYLKNINDELQAAFDSFDKFAEDFKNGRKKAREKAPKATLQSIHEDEDEPTKSSGTDNKNNKTGDKSTTDLKMGVSHESNTDPQQRASKKRTKHEVEDMSSPEQDKRQKRSASVKAQSIITKQVNVNLTHKMRREDTDKSSSRRRREEDDKENDEPLPNIQIKQEKISMQLEPMEVESLPLDIEVKQESDKDEIAMPPPSNPVPRPRKAAKEKQAEESSDEETGKKRSNRSRKETPDIVAAPVSSQRSSRASSRAARLLEPDEPRPKRTRAKKKVSEPPPPEPEEPVPQEKGSASPVVKPRPKRTRRGQKAAEKPEEKSREATPPPLPEAAPPPLPEAAPPPLQEANKSPKEERVSNPEVSSPILQKAIPKKTEKLKKEPIVKLTRSNFYEVDALDKTRVLEKASDINTTVVLPNGVFNHAPLTPKIIRDANETVVIEPANRETVVLDKHMDATFVLDKEPKAVNVTDDNSLLTDDSDLPEPHTPPKQDPPQLQPTSAVKEKVQQFEELASRVTRTKTRALAKKQEDEAEHTPPDKIVKPVLSVETLTKMDNMIFNGKRPQISSSAAKPRVPVASSSKPGRPVSSSKLSGICRAREAEELKREREDARKKKEAMLEAKRELQRRKREEKMAAAAAAREAAERERRVAMEAAVRGKMEKQANADQGRLERLKEVERKKLELARKVAETEERRRAEEQARQQRLADEQRRADDARRKQLEETVATKKEAAIMAKVIEKKQKEYNEKQKMKHKMEDKSHTPLKHPLAAAISPVYMQDGFQYLNSDDEDEATTKPVPSWSTSWSTSKARQAQLAVQSQLDAVHVDRLFSVRVHTPDLRAIFPGIERARLKRTSSAVWRTPPARMPAFTE